MPAAAVSCSTTSASLFSGFRGSALRRSPGPKHQRTAARIVVKGPMCVGRERGRGDM